MMTARLFVTLALVLGVVAFGELVGPQGWRLYSDGAQLVVGAGAAWVCFAAARRRSGIQRQWRVLVGIGLTGWSLTRLWWLVQDAVLPSRPITAASDLGFFLLAACLLVALLLTPYTRPRPAPTSARRDQIALIIDSVLIAGSLLALAISALPDGIFDWDGQTTA